MLALSLAGSAYATAPVIPVFSGDGSPPKMFVHEGEQRGVLIDILNYADKQMPQHRFELSLYPWARAYMASASGQGGLLGISWTWRRDEVFDYSEPLFYDEVVIVVRKGHEFNYQSLSDLQGKTLGTVRGASFGSAFDRAHQDGVFSIEGDNGARNRLSKLAAGRIDCALFNVGRGRVSRNPAPPQNTQKPVEEFCGAAGAAAPRPELPGLPQNHANGRVATRV